VQLFISDAINGDEVFLFMWIFCCLAKVGAKIDPMKSFSGFTLGKQTTTRLSSRVGFDLRITKPMML
jgi:hypothetical protein